MSRVLPVASLGFIIEGLIVVLTLHWYCYGVMQKIYSGRYTSGLYFRIVDEWSDFSLFLIASYCLVGLGLLLALPIRRTRVGRIGIGMAGLLFLVEIVLHTCVHAPRLYTF